MSAADFLLFEFPCNEKIRMYLRLESLFRHYDWFCSQDSSVAHQAAIASLFDLLDATARSDLRNELIQELERHRQRLMQLRGNREVNQETLIRTLDELGTAISGVAGSVGRTGQSVRENQWLQLIRTRQSIAGGTCEFDLPQLHLWLNQSPLLRRTELQSYVATLAPIRQAATLLLRLLRANSVRSDYVARGGTVQISMPRGQSYALAQIWLYSDSGVVPEVSANKYMLWIRFSRPDAEHKLHPVRSENISFSMGLSSLN